MRIATAARPGGGQVSAMPASGGAAPRSRGNTSGTRLLTELVLLALSTPALMSGLALAGLPHEDILRMAGLWSIVQMTFLVVLAYGHAREWAEPRLRASDAAALGRRAELAEAAVRREEERMHELRSTVSGIGMTHRLLRERTAELPQPARSRLEGLYESELTRLERLVDDDRPVEGTLEVLDVASLVDPLVDALRLRGIQVTWRPGAAIADGRPDEVVEIVHNLLENAARHAAGTEVTVGVSTKGSQVWVRVSDSGPGIPETLLPTLFERGTRRAGSPGHGLGLHIARRLARGMGGDLWLDPVRGSRGAGFTLALPASVDGVACLARAE